MRICIRFHMSGIFDSGWARKLLDALRRRGEVTALVTGTTGATALLDACMEKEVESIPMRWSVWLKASKEKFDIGITATHTQDSERVKAECWHLSRRVPEVPLVGIDTGCRIIIPWSEGTGGFAAALGEELGFSVQERVDFGRTFWTEGGREYRRVLAVTPGDLLVVDWIVVGRVRSSEVVVVTERGRIVEILGTEVKAHGVEKLGRIDLSRCKIDSVATLRGEIPCRRRVDYAGGDRAAFINHSGYNVYSFLKWGIRAAVTVGDDTTAVAGDILSRYGVPVVGITDGDSDGLLSGGRYAKGSLILRVAKDDAFGEAVFTEIFRGMDCIDCGDFEALKEKVVGLAKGKGCLIRIMETGGR